MRISSSSSACFSASQHEPVHVEPGEFFEVGQDNHEINLHEKYTKVNTSKIYELMQNCHLVAVAYVSSRT